MNLVEILRFAVRGLAANKFRSSLTTLGITIGVGAVILLVAVGSGASAAVERSIAGLGTNVLTVSPVRGPGQSSTGRPLTVADAKALVDPLGAPDVRAASPVVSTSAAAVYGAATHEIPQFAGTYPEYFETTNSPLAQGAAFTDEDVLAARKVVVLGSTAAESLFGT